MTGKNQWQADMKHDHQRDQLDDILDAALAKFAEAEPRPGLENRVLASLRAEGAKVTRHAWWRWSLAGAAAVAVVAVVIAWRSNPVSRRPIAHDPSVVTPRKPDSEPQVAMNSSTNQAIPAVRQPLRSNPRRPHSNAVAGSPKLNVFPSPQPLSEQEKILANYVAQFHDQAVLIARVTNEELKRDRIEVFGKSENPDEVADQQTTNR